MRLGFKLTILLLCSLLAGGLVMSDFDFKKVLSYLAYPVIGLNYHLQKTCSLGLCFFDRTGLSAENQQLKSEINDLQAQNIALISQASYWQQNQEIIDFSKRYNFEQQILAQVLLKKITEQEHYFLVDQGANQAVSVGMVAVYKNVLLGKIVEVYPNYAKLLLLTDRNCKIAVYDEHTKAAGICCGQNQPDRLLLSYVSHLDALGLGNLLISSGNGEIFPQGFGVGKISDLKNAGMYYEAHASLLIELEKISNCYLIAANKS